MASKKSHIRYSPAIRKVGKLMNRNYIVKGNAIELIQFLLNRLNDDLIAHFKKKSNIQPKDAQVAVKSVVAGQMQQFALGYSHQTLFRFSNGLLRYKPETPDEKRRRIEKHLERLEHAKRLARKRAAQERAREMQASAGNLKAIQEIAKKLFPKVKIQPKAKLHIDAMAGRLMDVLVDQSKILGVAEKTISTDEVKKAVLQILPGEIKDHAVAAAEKKVKRKSPAAVGPLHPLEFNAAIQSLSRMCNPDAKLQAEAKKLVNGLLLALADKMAEKAKELGARSNAISATEVKQALEQLALPAEILQHARAEGLKGVFNLQSGMLHFEPVRRRKSVAAALTAVAAV